MTTINKKYNFTKKEYKNKKTEIKLLLKLMNNSKIKSIKFLSLDKHPLLLIISKNKINN
jgi:hypothetical protein